MVWISRLRVSMNLMSASGMTGALLFLSFFLFRCGPAGCGRGCGCGCGCAAALELLRAAPADAALDEFELFFCALFHVLEGQLEAPRVADRASRSRAPRIFVRPCRSSLPRRFAILTRRRPRATATDRRWRTPCAARRSTAAPCASPSAARSPRRRRRPARIRALVRKMRCVWARAGAPSNLSVSVGASELVDDGVGGPCLAFSRCIASRLLGSVLLAGSAEASAALGITLPLCKSIAKNDPASYIPRPSVQSTRSAKTLELAVCKALGDSSPAPSPAFSRDGASGVKELKKL